MLGKNEYSVIDNKYILPEEKIFNMFSDPAGFIVANPQSFYAVPLYNLFSPGEIILARIQNLFHSMLQAFVNGDLYFELRSDGKKHTESGKLNLAKIYDLISLIEKYKIENFIKLKILLENANIKPTIAEDELAEIIAEFYREFSSIRNKGITHEVSINTALIKKFKPEEYKNEPALETDMKELGSIVNGMRGYLKYFLLHGSLATLDYKYKTSDCDTLMVISKQAAENASELIELKLQAGKLRSLFIAIDPLQHHGVFAYTEQDMEFYPQTWLPLVLADYSKLLYSKDKFLDYKIRPCLIERRSELWNITYAMRHDWIINNYPADLNSYKQYLQIVLLMPVLFYQFHGTYIYKKYMFNLLKKEVPAGLYKIIDEATYLRNSNLYIKALNESYEEAAQIPQNLYYSYNSEFINNGRVNIPGWLKRISNPEMLKRSADLSDYLFEKAKVKFLLVADIWEDELLHLPQCAGGDGDLWARAIIKNPSFIEDSEKYTKPQVLLNGTHYTLSDFPVEYDMNFYNTTKQNYINALTKQKGIVSIYQMGSVSMPGISDIDFIVVVDKEFGNDELKQCINEFYKLTDAERYVIKHPPSAFISEELFGKTSYIHPTFNLARLFGDELLKGELEQAKPVMQLINIVDLFLMEFPVEFFNELQDKEIAVRNYLMRMKSLTLSANIMRANGIEIPQDVQIFLDNILGLISSWFTNDDKTNLKMITQSILKAEDTILQIIESLRNKFIGLGFTVDCNEKTAGIYAGKVFFVNDWNIEDAKFIANSVLDNYGYSCSVLPAEFLFSVIQYANGDDRLSHRIKRFFWLHPSLCAVTSPEIEERRMYLSAHYEMLENQGCKGGLFYPYHFCPDYWNPDFITWKWHNEINEYINSGMQFSENLVNNSIKKWYEKTIAIKEIERDKNAIVTLSFTNGFYHSENGIRWLSKNGKFFVTSAKPLKLSFELTNQDASFYKQFPFEVKVLVNGLQKCNCIFNESHQTNIVYLTLNSNLPNNEIDIISSASFVPAECGINQDVRELSVVMGTISVTVLDEDALMDSKEEQNEKEDIEIESYQYVEDVTAGENEITEYSVTDKKLIEAEELIDKNQYESAKKLLAELITENAMNTEAINDLAVICVLEENYEEALKLIDLVLEIDPANETAKDNFKYICEKQENPPNSKLPENEKNNSNKNTLKAFVNAGAMILESEKLIENKQYKEARIVLDYLLKEDKDDTDALNNLSVLEILEGNYDKADEIINKVLLISENDETALDNAKYLNSLRSKGNKSENTVEKINKILQEADSLIYKKTDMEKYMSYLDETIAQLRPYINIVLNRGDAELFLLKITNILAAKYQYLRRHTSLVAKPFGLLVDPANGCNLHCPGCIHTPGKNSAYLWDKSLLSKETFAKYLEVYAPYGTHMLFYNYGEPFINKMTPEFIAMAKQYRLFTSVSTNLSLPIDADAIVKSGLDYLILSIDGATEDVYQKYRKGGRLEVVYENIKKLVEAKKKYSSAYPFITWQYLVFEHNKNEAELAVRIADELGIDEIYFTDPFDVSWSDPEIVLAKDAAKYKRRVPFYRKYNGVIMENGKDVIYCNNEKTWKQKLKETGELNFNEEIRKDLPVCDWLYKGVVIDANGRVLPCCSAPTGDKNLVFGSISVNSGQNNYDYNTNMFIKARLGFANNKAYKDAVKKADANDIPYCEECGGNNASVNVTNEHLYNYLVTEKIFEVLSNENKKRLTNWQ